MGSAAATGNGRVHRDVEQRMLERFLREPAAELARFVSVRQADHSELVGNALKVFRDQIDPTPDDFSIKRQTLFLTRRGGKGVPQFVSPFTGGAGTTCGKWTHVVKFEADGTVRKGFMKAALINGFCIVGCPYCFHQGMVYTEGMDVALNWQDLADELLTDFRGYPDPINFGETSGLIEFDEWFFNGRDGSIAQFVINACAAADVNPVFLDQNSVP
jgi:hypothetical protein